MDPRRKTLLKLAKKAGCDALVSFEPENMYYMTGFWGDGAALLEKGGRATVVASPLEAGRARSEAPGCQVTEAADVMSEAVSRLRKRRPCTDARGHATVSALRRAMPGVLADEGPFTAARMVKDRAEASVLRRASRLIDEMFEICASRMKEGMRESELQSLLMAHACEKQLFDTGYRHTLNPLIVAGGPNGALPHAQVTGRRFRQRDLVVVDITLRYRGYVSDATRTFAVGRPTRAAREAYDAVRESQLLGLNAARAGAKCSEVDAACRGHLASRGLEKYFVHSTGHGVGLEVHEQPGISARSISKLKKGMAITVEPGVYVPGRFGVRIEDSILVRDGAPSVMHRFTKDLVTV